MHQSSEPLLSVVIVNYNGKQFMKDCLESIDRGITVPHETIVVDNASQDDSVAYIRKTFPHVYLIASEANLGFAGGNNIGVRSAKGAYILLLNNDAFLETDVVAAIMRMDLDESIGVVGAKMLGKQGEYRLSCGRFPEPGRLICIASLYYRSGPFASGDFSLKRMNDNYEVHWVEGSFFLTRKSLWDRLGGMDEDYFMYGEDVDFCRSVREAGYRTIYMPGIVYRHIGGYREGRMGMLVNGFRRYHAKFSLPAKRLVAGVVLDLGLVIRVLRSLPLAVVGNEQYRAKIRSCVCALMRRSVC